MPLPPREVAKLSGIVTMSLQRETVIIRAANDVSRKDKTMVHILESLARLENKFDNLSMGPSGGSSSPSDAYSPAIRVNDSRMSQSMSGQMRETDKDNRTAQLLGSLQERYQHLTVPHKVMLWPAIYVHLISSGIPAASDLQHVLQEGTPWFIRQELHKHPQGLPINLGLPCFAISSEGSQQRHPTSVAFPTLSIPQIKEYTEAYFNTFNVLLPLLNKETFMDETVAALLRDGYADGDQGAVLALLVFALGQVAIEGVHGRPISVHDTQPSGLRGGSVEHPPGLAIFNEARRRIGFVATLNTLENVQIMLLQASYFEANACHLDFFRSTVAASMSCQVLIRCEVIDWSTLRGDLIKRAYWACVLNEDLYHLDLDLPKTGIHLLEDDVPLPYFHDVSAQHGASSPSSSRAKQGAATSARERGHFQYHFLAMIALRRLISRIHDVIHECEVAATQTQAEPLYPGMKGKTPSTPAASGVQSSGSDDYGGPPVAVIREMVRQLDSWRALLPRAIQWSDNDKFDFPANDPNARRSTDPLFAPDRGDQPVTHKYNLDIATAQLRTRFYYARFMMYRPFVYKALHFPELMSNDDCNCCALAIKAACLWPLAMAPPKDKKRLVPHLFAWTQNFMGILLILKMCSVSDCLRSICDEGGVVGRDEISRTVGLMLEWMRDVRQVDGIAEWSWGILAPLYGVAGGEMQGE